jgi:large subunit ribosomal protein L4
MKLNIRNAKNETVDTLDVSDELLAGRVKSDLIWASVVQENAAKRRGTHMTKNRALVSGGGKKPYKQKGTGRPQVGSSRTPLWRKGGTVFGPQPRSYEYDLPKKVRVGAVRAAFAQKLTDGAVIVVDRLESEDGKTKGTAEMFRRLGVSGKALVIDVKPTRSSRSRRAISRAATRRRITSDRARHHGYGARDRDARGNREAAGDAGIAHMKLTDVIKRPLVTEKTTLIREGNRTPRFQVAPATKVDIKRRSRSCSVPRSKRFARRSRTAR